jgi:hypothetical protein
MPVLLIDRWEDISLELLLRTLKDWRHRRFEGLNRLALDSYFRSSLKGGVLARVRSDLVNNRISVSRKSKEYSFENCKLRAPSEKATHIKDASSSISEAFGIDRFEWNSSFNRRARRKFTSGKARRSLLELSHLRAHGHDGKHVSKTERALVQGTSRDGNNQVAPNDLSKQAQVFELQRELIKAQAELEQERTQALNRSDLVDSSGDYSVDVWVALPDKARSFRTKNRILNTDKDKTMFCKSVSNYVSNLLGRQPLVTIEGFRVNNVVHFRVSGLETVNEARALVNAFYKDSAGFILSQTYGRSFIKDAFARGPGGVEVTAESDEGVGLGRRSLLIRKRKVMPHLGLHGHDGKHESKTEQALVQGRQGSEVNDEDQAMLRLHTDNSKQAQVLELQRKLEKAQVELLEQDRGQAAASENLQSNGLIVPSGDYAVDVLVSLPGKIRPMRTKTSVLGTKQEKAVFCEGIARALSTSLSREPSVKVVDFRVNNVVHFRVFNLKTADEARDVVQALREEGSGVTLITPNIFGRIFVKDLIATGPGAVKLKTEPGGGGSGGGVTCESPWYLRLLGYKPWRHCF